MADAYQLLDVGGGARLERFGDRVTDRPYPAALGARARPRCLGRGRPPVRPRTRLDRGGRRAEPWPVTIEGVTLELRPTDAGQVGLFPEHAAMLPWLDDRVARRTRDAGPTAAGPRPAVLHLFAYTGLATLVMVAAGARVTHVDASRPAVALGARNADAVGAGRPPIRWIVDDAVAFTGREVRRGRRYAGVVLDPPSYGHGPGTGAWRLERDLPALLDACAEVLEPDGFLLLTAHTPGFDGDRLAHALAAATRPAGGIGGSGRPGALRRPTAASSSSARSRGRRGGHDGA